LSSIDVKTNRGKDFIFENDDLHEIIIFSCDTTNNRSFKNVSNKYILYIYIKIRT